jgi:hypothetical protein
MLDEVIDLVVNATGIPKASVHWKRSEEDGKRVSQK